MEFVLSCNSEAIQSTDCRRITRPEGAVRLGKCFVRRIGPLLLCSLPGSRLLQASPHIERFGALHTNGLPQRCYLFESNEPKLQYPDNLI